MLSSYIRKFDLGSNVHGLKFLQQKFASIWHLDTAYRFPSFAIGALALITDETTFVANIDDELITRYH